MSCPFCDIVAGTAPAEILGGYGGVSVRPGAVVIRPLEPVTEGHVLVIPTVHVRDAVADPDVTGQVMACAAEWAESVGSCNIITSVGPAATQSVWHLHVHVVPRRAGDGLLLPWDSNEAHMRANNDFGYQFYNG